MFPLAGLIALSAGCVALAGCVAPPAAMPLPAPRPSQRVASAGSPDLPGEADELGPPGDTVALQRAAALAEARVWTVRLIALSAASAGPASPAAAGVSPADSRASAPGAPGAGTLPRDTLVGPLHRPRPGTIRVGLHDVPLGRVLSLERRADGGGTPDSRILGGVAVGGLLGLTAGLLSSAAGGAQAGAGEGSWFLGGALVGLAMAALDRRPAGPEAWVLLWRRD